MSAQQRAAAVRRAAGLFRLEGRGLIEVRGRDRVRWLDGMVTNDVAALAPGPECSGCYALLLTQQGRIVADLHVLLREQAFWLETAASAVRPASLHLERYIVADDVELADRSGSFARLAVEGPAALGILESALGGAVSLARDACADLVLGGAEVTVAAFGWSGQPAYQIFVPAGAEAAVRAVLCRAGEARELVEGDAEALEILRIEAGLPRLGAELGEDVLPAEARLERAISTTKGCFTGQEVVARMATRGRVSHRLVGLCFQGESVPAAGQPLLAAGRPIGEVTSACLSPQFGAIALAFVRLPHDAPGTELSAGDLRALVSPLPFGAGSPRPAAATGTSGP